MPVIKLATSMHSKVALAPEACHATSVSTWQGLFLKLARILANNNIDLDYTYGVFIQIKWVKRQLLINNIYIVFSVACKNDSVGFQGLLFT